MLPNKGGTTVIMNEKNELILIRTIIGWRVCIEYRRLNTTTRKDHFPPPLINQMLERLFWHIYYCFLDGYTSYNQIVATPQDQKKTAFTCHMVYLHIEGFHSNYVTLMQHSNDMLENHIKLFLDEFSAFDSTFDNCFFNLSLV